MLTYVKLNAWHIRNFQSYNCYYDYYYHCSVTGNKHKMGGGSLENTDPTSSFFVYLTSEIWGNFNHF